MKLCINCKHVLPSLSGKVDNNSRCGYERPTSLVTGLQADRESLPYAEFDRRITGRCTPLATNWEAADHVMSEEEEKELLSGSIRHE